MEEKDTVVFNGGFKSARDGQKAEVTMVEPRPANMGGGNAVFIRFEDGHQLAVYEDECTVVPKAPEAAASTPAGSP